MLQGQFDDARSMYLRALAGREKCLVKDHPDTLKAATLLAELLSNQGHYDDANISFEPSKKILIRCH